MYDVRVVGNGNKLDVPNSEPEFCVERRFPFRLHIFLVGIKLYLTISEFNIHSGLCYVPQNASS